MGRVDGKLVINPTLEQREVSDMDMTVSGTKEAIMMVEAGANEVPEMEMLDAILFAHEEIKKIVEFIEEIVREVGRPKQEVVLYKPLDEIDQAVREYAAPKMKEAIRTPDKLERLENMDAVEAETKEHFEEIYPEGARDIDSVLYNITKETVRAMIMDEGIRPDNRKLDEIRPIWCETACCQGLTAPACSREARLRSFPYVLWLRPARLRPSTVSPRILPRDICTTITSQDIPWARPRHQEVRAEGRSATEPWQKEHWYRCLPAVEDFPYAIRVVSEVLSSNGSTSMGSTCGSCLALMDAGVPIKKPVAGIAMGTYRESERGRHF